MEHFLNSVELRNSVWRRCDWFNYCSCFNYFDYCIGLIVFSGQVYGTLCFPVQQCPYFLLTTFPGGWASRRRCRPRIIIKEGQNPGQWWRRTRCWFKLSLTMRTLLSRLQSRGDSDSRLVPRVDVVRMNDHPKCFF